MPVSNDIRELFDAGTTLGGSIDAYTEIISLRFTSRDAAALSEVKWNEKIRRYSKGMQESLVGASAEGLDRVLDDMVDAWDQSEIASDIAGSFSATSRITGPLGLLPGIGTITGIAGMGADAASALARRRAETFRWYQLGPEIAHFETSRDLENALRRHRNRSGGQSI